MALHTVGALAMHPTRNAQGQNNYVFSLSTGWIINRVHATKLPMPDDVIKRVHALARRQKANPGLVFLDRNQVPDVDIDAGDYADDDDSDYVPGEDADYSQSKADDDDDYSDYDSDDDSNYHSDPDDGGEDDTDDFDSDSENGSDIDAGTTGVDNTEAGVANEANKGGTPGVNVEVDTGGTPGVDAKDSGTPGVDAEDGGTPGVDAEANAGTTGVDADENAEQQKTRVPTRQRSNAIWKTNTVPGTIGTTCASHGSGTTPHLFLANTDTDVNPDSDELLATPQMSMKKELRFLESMASKP
jgi:hypothetical protein